MKRRQQGFEDIFVVLIVIALCLGALIGGIFVISHFYGKYQCANYAEITGKQTRFAAFDVCYIKTADGWQRWDEYLKRSVASEGLQSLDAPNR